MTLIIVLIIHFCNALIAQDTKIRINTGVTKAAVYSINGFISATPFNESVNFDRVNELFVIGENDLFAIIEKVDIQKTTSLSFAPYPLDSLKGTYPNVEFGEAQILVEQVDPSVPNASTHNSVYDEDFLNKSIINFTETNGIITKSSDKKYILSGVVQKDLMMWEGYSFDNKHKGTITVVKWTLRDKNTNSILLEKETTGGYYFGKKFKPKNTAGLVETSAYSYRKAVISSLVQMLKSDEMTSKTFQLEINSNEIKQNNLTINTGDIFCSELDICVEATLTVKTEKGLGSGFFISSEGYLITNYHVIENESYPTVILSNGLSVPAEIIRFDERRDVALLKVTINGVTTIRIAEIDNIKSGEDVYAIGTPKDIALGQTISKGIVSAYRPGENAMIQTDVGVNSGNSRGPLLNNENMVIGIVTSKIIETGTEGIAFAIPINNALESLDILIK